MSERTQRPLGGQGQQQALTPEAWADPTALLLACGCKPGTSRAWRWAQMPFLALPVGVDSSGLPSRKLREARLPSACPGLLGGP